MALPSASTPWLVDLTPYCRMSASVQVFGRRNADTIHALLRPASKKRQGTKSRDVWRGSAAGAMGILPQVQACRGWIEAVAAIGLRRTMVPCVGVNERSAGSATGLVARRLLNAAQRCELGRCRLRASKNAGRCDRCRSMATAS